MTWGGDVVIGVDLGLRTGFAVIGPSDEGPMRLRRYGSTHFGSRSALRRGAPAMLADHPTTGLLVLEGDRDLARIWGQAATRQGVEVVTVAPEEWRGALLLDRERRTARDAKRFAGVKARAVIQWSREQRGPHRPPAPTATIRHDTAEAIMIAVWGALTHADLRGDELPFLLP